MISERGALVRGSDSPSGHTVHNTAGDTWRAPARHLIPKTCGRWCGEHTTRKDRPLYDGQQYPFFSGLGEERRTPRATSRPLDHGSTWYLRGRHQHSLALPDTKRVGRGLILCEIEGLSSRKLFFLSACWQFSTWKHKFRRVQPREQTILRSQTFPPVFPIVPRVSSTHVFFEEFGKKTLQHRVSISIGQTTRYLVSVS